MADRDNELKAKQMRELKGTLLVLLVIFAAFIWPTLYIYTSKSGVQVRINRITGNEQVRMPRGWAEDTRENRAITRRYSEMMRNSPPEPIPDYY